MAVHAYAAQLGADGRGASFCCRRSLIRVSVSVFILLSFYFFIHAKWENFAGWPHFFLLWGQRYNFSARKKAAGLKRVLFVVDGRHQYAPRGEGTRRGQLCHKKKRRFSLCFGRNEVPLWRKSNSSAHKPTINR